MDKRCERSQDICMRSEGKRTSGVNQEIVKYQPVNNEIKESVEQVTCTPPKARVSTYPHKLKHRHTTHSGEEYLNVI